MNGSKADVSCSRVVVYTFVSRKTTVIKSKQIKSKKNKIENLVSEQVDA